MFVSTLDQAPCGFAWQFLLWQCMPSAHTAADVGRSFEVEEGAGAGGARSMALLSLLRNRLGLYGFRRRDY